MIKEEIVVGPELSLVLGAVSGLSRKDRGLAMEDKVNEDDLHQSGVDEFLFDLTGRFFGETRGVRSVELGEYNQDQLGLRGTLARQISGRRK